MINKNTIEDIQLINQIAQQNQTALSQLYDLYARLVYAVVFKILGSVEEAEEVVLDVFAQVWRSAQRYDRKKGRVDSWLLMMARSRALDRLRSRQRQMKVVDASTQVVQTQSGTSVAIPEENLLIQERRECVMDALNQIPTAQRQVIELAYYQGLTQKEIAARIGVSLGTVKTRIRLGLNKLRGILE